MNTDFISEKILRGEVLKELLKFQGEFTRVQVIKATFSQNDGLPLTKMKSVLNYLNDKEYIVWERKDVTRSDDDVIRITAKGQDLVMQIIQDEAITI